MENNNKQPKDLEEVLHYHFYDYSKDEVINILLKEMDLFHKLTLYKEITTEE